MERHRWHYLVIVSDLIGSFNGNKFRCAIFPSITVL